MITPATSGTGIIVPQIIPPTNPIINIPSTVSQMYIITPSLSEWDINYSIGNTSTNIRTYSIQNITLNADLAISIQLPTFVIMNTSNNFIIPKNSTQTFSFQFIPDSTLINSTDETIQIHIAPISAGPIQLIA